ncbi:MAG TPA: cbb3-type cytochrome c oxidase subunit I [Gammaproteobacteria bacterium]|nr:cbb3-type cytochrome c oxidase subunit I [Gammaproteobacteria bacterium]
MHPSTLILPAGLHDADQKALARVLGGYTLVAAFWLVLATGVGLLVSLKFSFPDLASQAALTFGRLRPIHVNGAFYAWASPALVGLAYYVAAKTSRAPLYSEKLAWIGLALFNVAAVLGTIALDMGINNGNLEYREWPWPVRLIFLAALFVTAYNMIQTIRRRHTEEIYLSNWYTLGGVLWTCIIAIVATLPWYQHGLGQVAVSGFYMHNAVGLWFTPLALGIFYYALPKLLSRPIYSYALGVFAFWTNLIFYPIIGSHHFLFSPLPWWLQTTAIVFSVAMLVPVWGGSANYLLTLRGRWGEARHSYPLLFIIVGVLSYLLSSSQGTLEAFRSLQQTWHLTNYTVGHSHFSMYGFITFAIWGGIYALLPLATAKSVSRRAMGLHFWLALVGMVIYVGAMSIGGTIQGLDWTHGKPFIQSVIDMAPYWSWRTVGGSMMFLSHVIFTWNVWKMTWGRQREFAPIVIETVPERESAEPRPVAAEAMEGMQ